MVGKTTNVTLPTELVNELTARAKASGLSVPAYLAVLARIEFRAHDAEFVRSMRHAFAKYPSVLRELAK